MQTLAACEEDHFVFESEAVEGGHGVDENKQFQNQESVYFNIAPTRSLSTIKPSPIPRYPITKRTGQARRRRCSEKRSVPNEK